MEAFVAQAEIDVILVLGAISCGLYSTDETTAKLSINLL